MGPFGTAGVRTERGWWTTRARRHDPRSTPRPALGTTTRHASAPGHSLVSMTTYPNAPQDADGEARDLAFKRVKARRDLSAHAVTYLVVNTFLIGVWFMSGGGYFWPAWVMGGWGIGLALNAWDVLFRRPITEADIEREMRRGR